MIVMKFGGTSVGSRQSITMVRDIIVRHKDQEPLVVVSALSGMTDLLVEYAKSGEGVEEIYHRHQELIDELFESGNEALQTKVRIIIEQAFSEASGLEGAARTDRILSVGELCSATIVAAYVDQIVPATVVPATELFVTDGHFGCSEIIDEPTRSKIENFMLHRGKQIPIITGFIGATDQGQVTTFGRGGSDYSAALIGYYINADEIQIWTDVSGIYTTDPRNNDTAKLIKEMTFDEAAELAAFGGKVLHPKTMRPAVYGSIPLRIANTFDPAAASTRISVRTKRIGEVIAVVSKASTLVITVNSAEMLGGRGFLERISAVLAHHGISIDSISASETSVSMTLDNHGQLNAAIKELETFGDVAVLEGAGMVSLIGQGISSNPRTLQRIFDEVVNSGTQVHMVSVGARNINVSVVMSSRDVANVTARLHDEFIGRSEK